MPQAPLGWFRIIVGVNEQPDARRSDSSGELGNERELCRAASNCLEATYGRGVFYCLENMANIDL